MNMIINKVNYNKIGWHHYENSNNTMKEETHYLKNTINA